jgi:dTMP kinase
LIALEGIDGSGKSTQARALATALGALLTFEPGATPLGQNIRTLVLGNATEPPSVRAEALLMVADRAQHVDRVIAPALASGRWVVSDRFSASTLAYQGAGRGLDPAFLSGLVDWAAAGIWPDLSVLVDLAPDVARARIATSAPDRLERLEPAFFERVREGYRRLSFQDPAHWLVVDGTAAAEKVAASIAEGVRQRLGWPTAAGTPA